MLTASIFRFTIATAITALHVALACIATAQIERADVRIDSHQVGLRGRKVSNRLMGYPDESDIELQSPMPVLSR